MCAGSPNVILPQGDLTELSIEIADAKLHTALEVFDGGRIRCVNFF